MSRFRANVAYVDLSRFFVGRSNLRERGSVDEDFEGFASSDVFVEKRKKKRMTLFLSLSRRCLLEPNNAGVHTLLVRYKLEVRAHMANTYLCRRRNSRRSKNAEFQQTH